MIRPAKSRFQALFLMMLTIALVTGCVSPVKPELANQLPDSWVHQINNGQLTQEGDLQSWWKIFADPQLDQLVEQVLTENLSLAQAQERIVRTRLLLGHSEDEFFPEIHAVAHPIGGPSGRDTYFQYGFDASWELGLFGRRESTLRVAQAQMNAVEADVNAIRVSVIAEVVKTYFEIRIHQQLLQALTSQREIAERVRDQVNIRIRLGLSSVSELAQATQEINQYASQLLTQTQLVDEALQRLSFLLGRTQGAPELKAPSAQSNLALTGFVKLPADMLRTRPDIHLAEAVVLKNMGELGLAKAEVYPHVSLTGGYIYSANVTQNFTIDGAVHSTPAVGPVIDLPLFDWGRRQAAVKAQNSELNESLLAYKEAVLRAYTECETALGNLSYQNSLLALAQEAVKDQQDLLQQNNVRINLGLASRLSSLAQQQQQIQSQIAVLEAQGNQTMAYIALYKSLGGGALPQSSTDLATD